MACPLEPDRPRTGAIARGAELPDGVICLYLFVYPCPSLYVHSIHVSVFLSCFLFFSSSSLSLNPSFILFTQQHCISMSSISTVTRLRAGQKIERDSIPGTKKKKHLSFFHPALTHWKTHSVVRLTTGPKPLPMRVLHIVRYNGSSFNSHYPVISLKSSSITVQRDVTISSLFIYCKVTLHVSSVVAPIMRST